MYTTCIIAVLHIIAMFVNESLGVTSLDRGRLRNPYGKELSRSATVEVSFQKTPCFLLQAVTKGRGVLV